MKLSMWAIRWAGFVAGSAAMLMAIPTDGVRAQDSYSTQERLPWEQPSSGTPPTYGANRGYGDGYQPPAGGAGRDYNDNAPRNSPPAGGYPPGNRSSDGGGGYNAPPYDSGRGRAASPAPNEYGTPYQRPGGAPREDYSDNRNYDRGGAYDRNPAPRNYDGPGGAPYSRNYDRYAAPYEGPPRGERSYSKYEIVNAGHGFFGSLSKGMANVIEYTFKQAGRPNGYILGEDAGGAFVAGLRYGEGTLYTKDSGSYRVYWQGPSIGYDFGAEGSKVMVLIYNMRNPNDIYARYGGVQGSAYVVGGAGVQFLKRDDITVAPIRAGVGLRLGANIGYLKYTRRPTWNPF